MDSGKQKWLGGLEHGQSEVSKQVREGLECPVSRKRARQKQPVWVGTEKRATQELLLGACIHPQDCDWTRYNSSGELEVYRCEVKPGRDQKHGNE